MASESGVSTGGDDHAILSEGHVTPSDGHVTPSDRRASRQSTGHMIEGLESDEDTAGEGCDTLPPDSDTLPPDSSTTTTDAFNDPLEPPIDFIESHPHSRAHGHAHSHAHCFNGAIGHSRGVFPPPPSSVHYENWSILMEMEENKKGRPMKRLKQTRAVKTERYRSPYPLPRPGKGKTQHPRPSPSSRKRRLSGRLMRPAQHSNASEEGDMAQADEMGEGEGRDDGFVEGLDPISRRRNKKRAGGIHMLLSHPGGGGSPPSSPSNTPVSTRRRTSSRKSRLKPRSKKQSKPQLASADISTQESTTQGPGTSDSSDDGTSPDDGGTPLRMADDLLESCEEEGDESRSLTPNLKDPSSFPNPAQQHGNKSPSNGILGVRHLDHVSDIHPAHNPASMLVGPPDKNRSDDYLRLDSNETSDTDHHSMNMPNPLKGEHWVSRRLESDLSTAPFSSETSDMDTSGNERILTTDSQVDLNNGVHSPPLAKRVQVKGGEGGGGRGAGKVVDEGRAPSGSSGDEMLQMSRKKHMKKPLPSTLIPAKPSPPVTKKTSVSATESHSQPKSSGPTSSVPVKKQPLVHTKSNPLANKIISPHAQEKPHPPGTHLPARSLSSKGTRAKPPVGTKPAIKPLPSRPTPPPKPQGKVAVGGGMGGAKPPPKPVANHSKPVIGQNAVKPRALSVPEQAPKTGSQAAAGSRPGSQYGPGSRPGSQAGTGKGNHVRKAENNASQGVYKPLPKRPVKGGNNEKVESSAGTKPITSAANPPVPPSKPALPHKPRRLSSEKRPHLIKPQAGVPASAKPKTDNPMKRMASSPFISDSSKNPSSSELSGHSQSPSNSPYPSPSVQKRLPPTPPSKANKPGAMSKRPSAPALIADSSNNTSHKASYAISKRVSAPSMSASKPMAKTPSAPLLAGKTPSAPLLAGKTPSAPLLADSSRESSSSKTTSVASTTSTSNTITFTAPTTSTTPSPDGTTKGDSPVLSPNEIQGTESNSNPGLAAISEVSLSDTVGSPSPPPIPFRGYMVGERETSVTSPSMIQSSSSSSVASPSLSMAGESKQPSKTKTQSVSNEPTPPLPRPRNKVLGGPRRPPPSPPTSVVGQPTSNPPSAVSSTSVAQPTSNVLTGEGGKRGHVPSQPSESVSHVTSQRSSTPSMTSTVGSHYEIEDEDRTKEGYFLAHQSREVVEDVSYAIVKRSSLPRKPTDNKEGSKVQTDKPLSKEGDSSSSKAALKISEPLPLQQQPVKDPTSRLPTAKEPSRKKLGNTRRTPPRSPGSNMYESIDDLSKRLTRQTTDRGHQLLTHKKSFSPPPPMLEDEPPPLPSRPAPSKQKTRISRPLSQTTMTSSSPNLLEPTSYEGLVLVKDQSVQLPAPKTRDPVYDEIPERFRKKIVARSKRDYEEIELPEFEGDIPRLWVPPEKDKEKQVKEESSHYEKSSPVTEKKESPPSISLVTKETTPSISLVTKETTPSISLVTKENVVSRLATSGPKTISLEDLRENWTAPATATVVDMPLSPLVRKRQAKSFSSKTRQSLMYKRMSSDRMRRLRATTMEPTTKNKRMIRSSSLDQLDDRMERSTRNSLLHAVSSDSEDEDEPTILSPTTTGLPKIPSSDHLYRVPRSHRKPAGPFLCPPDVEPLYQYINTAEFLREPGEGVSTRPQGSSSPDDTPGGGGKKQNQLELARQLSLRKLWCELPEVIQSGVLDTLTSEERKLQEAIFEVISSEDSYLRSLDVLIQHFMDDPGMNPYLPEGRRVMDKRQHHVIFSNVKEVREVSSLFLEKLHSRQRESAVVRNIADIILDFAENHFDCYIRYCTNQVYQIREMQDMISNPSNVMFRDYLRRLESDKCCQNLNIQSFLLLPMQRITRLPLLILAILNRTPLDHPDHDVVEKTLRSVQKLVTACNDGARKMDRTEQLHEIHKKLDFGKLKPFPLVSASRQLERRGMLLRLQVEQKLLGKLKVKKKPLYFFIFTDYVIVTKRKKDPKGDYIYRVKDYASRAVVEVEWLHTHPGVSFPKFGEQNHIAKATYAVSTANSEHAFLMLFLDNASQKEENYILLAQNDTDKTRWMECLMRPDQKDEEKIYQHWDCPQVQAVYDYQAQQPDELDLERGDVVKVYRKMADGWYEGERLRDMQWGWFPSNFTQEIENAHTRARNLRQTHKLNTDKSNARLAMQM